MSEELISHLSESNLLALKTLCEQHDMIESRIITRMTYYDLFKKEVEPAIVYSYLALTGYLRIERIGKDAKTKDPVCRVGMVNEEIIPAFEALVERAVDVETKVSMRLVEHIFAKDAEAAARDIEILISGCAIDRSWYSNPVDNDKAHDIFKSVISSHLNAGGGKADEEVHKGLGPCDIFVRADGKKPPLAIEIKTSKNKDSEVLSQDALDDMFDKGKTTEPLDIADGLIAMGIGIRQKKVHIRFA